MKNYIEIERELNAIPGIKSTHPYRSDNFMTPWVVGFIPLAKSYKAEISYGEALGGGYAIGFTLFIDGRLAPYTIRKNYDKCFMDDEIGEIVDHANSIVNQLA